MSTTHAPGTRHRIPARSSVAVRVRKGQKMHVINTHGTQVVDFWTFVARESAAPSTLSTHLSMSHTRGATLHLSPLPGDVLVTNRRTPILRLVRDTTPGVHDTLIAACDRARYAQLGAADGHANCTDNLYAALAAVELALPVDCTPPDPLNLFMNIPVVPATAATAPTANNLTAGAEIRFESPVCEKGGTVVFEALEQCVVVMSACPQDLVKVNNMAPTDAHFELED